MKSEDILFPALYKEPDDSRNASFKLLTLQDVLAWYSEFLLVIDLKILIRKTGARLSSKIGLISVRR
jgi:hypothetical protein